MNIEVVRGQLLAACSDGQVQVLYNNSKSRDEAPIIISRE
jgi:hypothetical protein